ncbi:hypothetical protein HY310_01405 [Candidatus Microgenomates bacterium]|nr:hypothetical protein [Candidatus Microgenomates bacterium]
MKLVEGFLHFFTPRHTNNHKARALHISSITTYIALLLVFQVFITGVAKFSPGILGYASNISVGDLLRYTNDRRLANGQGTVVLNDTLSKAAGAKAADMFANQYWAHTSPQGKDPWSFINAAGYKYLFAGENLARDFGDSKSVVDAWMNSPSHRDNLLNSRYQDVGFAVMNGKYGNYETTLVVQMFGAKSVNEPTVEAPIIKQEEKQAPVVAAPTEEKRSTPSGVVLNTDTNIPGSKMKVDIFAVTRNISIGLIGMLLAVLVVDSALVYKRKVVRISGHNFAHLVFLLALFIALNLIGRGLVI